MKHKKHHHKILTLSLIILAVTLAVSVLYRKGLLVESPVRLPLIIPTAAPQQKEFVSIKFNFKVSYPYGWNQTQWDFYEVTDLTSAPEGSIIFQISAFGKEGKFEVLVWENRSKMPVTSWVSTFLHEEIEVKNIPQDYNLTFQGREALHIINLSKARKKSLEYIFFNIEDRVYELIFEKDDISDNDKIYEKIKESFTLINDDKAQTVINLAKKDLAGKKSISESEIQVTQVKEVQWSDSSLGCPKPGQMYLQVITPGFEITLTAKGMNYVYHTDLEKRVILCS